jgi:hypothetical protein
MPGDSLSVAHQPQEAPQVVDRWMCGGFNELVLTGNVLESCQVYAVYFYRVLGQVGADPCL